MKKELKNVGFVHGLHSQFESRFTREVLQRYEDENSQEFGDLIEGLNPRDILKFLESIWFLDSPAVKLPHALSYFNTYLLNSEKNAAVAGTAFAKAVILMVSDEAYEKIMNAIRLKQKSTVILGTLPGMIH